MHLRFFGLYADSAAMTSFQLIFLLKLFQIAPDRFFRDGKSSLSSVTRTLERRLTSSTIFWCLSATSIRLLPSFFGKSHCYFHDSASAPIQEMFSAGSGAENLTCIAAICRLPRFCIFRYIRFLREGSPDRFSGALNIPKHVECDGLYGNVADGARL